MGWTHYHRTELSPNISAGDSALHVAPVFNWAITVGVYSVWKVRGTMKVDLPTLLLTTPTRSIIKIESRDSSPLPQNVHEPIAFVFPELVRFLVFPWLWNCILLYFFTTITFLCCCMNGVGRVTYCSWWTADNSLAWRALIHLARPGNGHSLSRRSLVWVPTTNLSIIDSASWRNLTVSIVPTISIVGTLTNYFI